MFRFAVALAVVIGTAAVFADLEGSGDDGVRPRPDVTLDDYCGSDICSPWAVCDANDVLEQYQCVCKDGFFGDGISCVDVDECVTESALCDFYAACTNTEGGYECLCDPRFTGDGLTCTEEVVTGRPKPDELEEGSGEDVTRPRPLEQKTTPASPVEEKTTPELIEETTTSAPEEEVTTRARPVEPSTKAPRMRSTRCKCYVNTDQAQKKGKKSKSHSYKLRDLVEGAADKVTMKYADTVGGCQEVRGKCARHCAGAGGGLFKSGFLSQLAGKNSKYNTGDWLCYDVKSTDPVSVEIVGRLDRSCKTSAETTDDKMADEHAGHGHEEKHAGHGHEEKVDKRSRHTHEDKHAGHDHEKKEKKEKKKDKYAVLETTGFTSDEALCCQKGEKWQFTAGLCAADVSVDDVFGF